MRRAVLFYNPHAGQRRGLAATKQAAAVLRQAGVEVAITATMSRDSARQQARDAVVQGFDTIFACGGDGTIQDLAQGLIGTDVALAIIPLGTANVLAHDLGIPREPVAAARAALTAIPLRIGVGRADCQSNENNLVTRYFLSVAGAGQDGYLFHQVVAGEKQTFGTTVYFAKALWVWLMHRMEWFSADVSATDASERQPVTQLLVVRLHDFGSPLRDLAPGASLLQENFRVVLFKTSGRWSYLLYILRGILGTKWQVPGVELHNAKRIRLTPAGVVPVYLEADGELLGQLPAEITMVPDGLTLLVPEGFSKNQSHRSKVATPSS